MNPTRHALAPVDAKSLPAYSPTTYIDFNESEHSAAFEAALAQARGELGREYPLVIGGERVKGEATFESVNPSKPSEVIGRFQSGTKEQAAQAVEVAFQAFATWSRMPAAERAAYLVEAAKRHARAPHRVLGVDGARGRQELGRGRRRHRRGDRLLRVLRARDAALRRARSRCVQLPGEKDELDLHPARRRRRHPAVELPARDPGRHDRRRRSSPATRSCSSRRATRPTIAAKFVEVLRGGRASAGRRQLRAGQRRGRRRRAGRAPEDALHLLHRLARGRPAHQRARRRSRSQGQIWIKRVVAEMGGKDAIVVDADADLDAAVEGVVAAAFGFQGQKCSACSRAIVDRQGLRRSSSRSSKRSVENDQGRRPRRSGERHGPGDQRAAHDDDPRATSRSASRKAACHRRRRGRRTDGYFIQPTVIADVDAERAHRAGGDLRPGARGHQGAATSTTRSTIANDTEYGLTGAVYTKNREKLERAEREFHVGNLYLNRKCTGAMVGAHPFGGFNMSRHRLEGRRPGLSAAVPPGEKRRGEGRVAGGGQRINRICEARTPRYTTRGVHASQHSQGPADLRRPPGGDGPQRDHLAGGRIRRVDRSDELSTFEPIDRVRRHLLSRAQRAS